MKEGLRYRMTDNEIIKALECCKGKNCNTCPCFDEDIECGELLIGHTLDLINRQKAEIERLQSANSYQKGLIDRMYIGQKSLVDYAKSKAIKEFAERIKAESYLNDGVFYIDKIVKEMTEVTNENNSN